MYALQVVNVLSRHANTTSPGAPTEISEAASHTPTTTDKPAEDVNLVAYLRKANHNLVLVALSVFLSFTVIAPLIASPLGLFWAIQVLRETATEKTRFSSARGRAWIAVIAHAAIVLAMVIGVIGVIGMLLTSSGVETGPVS